MATTIHDAIRSLEMEQSPIPSLVKTAQQMSLAASASKEFHLVSIASNLLPALFAKTASNEGPIIVDKNKDKLGRLDCGFVPKLIVVSGIDAFKEMRRERKPTVQVWAGRDILKALKVKPHNIAPVVAAGPVTKDYVMDRPNQAAPALGSFNGPNLGMVPDFTTYGAPGSEANNPMMKTMLNVEEALRMYVAGVVNGEHKPIMSPMAVVPPHLVNAAKEARIAASEFSKIPFDFSVMDFIHWQNKQLSVRQSLMTKNNLFASSYAYVGDDADPSTWLLDISTPKKIDVALRRVMSASGIPESDRPSVKSILQAKKKLCSSH